jgi:hypothetical protein
MGNTSEVIQMSEDMKTARLPSNFIETPCRSLGKSPSREFTKRNSCLPMSPTGNLDSDTGEAIIGPFEQLNHDA